MKFLRYGWITALLLLALIFPVAAQDAISPGDTVESQLESEAAEYSLTASAGDVIEFALSSDDFDALLTVTNARGNELARNDDSDGSNSRLLFIAPEDGNYTVIAGSYDGSGSGAYTLTARAIEALPARFSEPLELTSDGTNTMYVSFEGEAGDVVNIFANSANEQDIRIELNDLAGDELTYDDDNGPGVDPYIRRFILPSSGTFLVEVKPSYGNELSGTISFTVEKTELITLGEAPEMLTLGEEFDQEIYRFEAEAGQTYRLSVKSIDGEDQLSLSVDISQAGSFTQSTMSSSSVSGMSMDFTPDESGTVEVKVRAFLFLTDEISLTITVEEVA